MLVYTHDVTLQDVTLHDVTLHDVTLYDDDTRVRHGPVM